MATTTMGVGSLHIGDTAPDENGALFIDNTTPALPVLKIQTAATGTGGGPVAVADAAGSVAAHTGDTTDAHAASAISNTPAGTIAATNVQSAINELDSEKQAITGKDAASGYAGLDPNSRVTKGVKTTDYVTVDDGTKGFVLKDTQATPHYWLLKADGAGSTTLTDLGTSAP